MRKWIYKLERIRDSIDWPKGSIVYATHKCAGWRVVGKIKC